MTPEAEALIVDNLALVGQVASFFLRGKQLPGNVDREDLEGVAQIGLVKAALSYDPSKPGHFKGWAWVIMRGAVVDYLRKGAPMSRLAWKRIKEGATDVPVVRLVDLEHAAACYVDDHAEAPNFNDLDKAVALLRPKLRNVLLWYFYDDLSLKEIGSKLGICESRASQLKTEALGHLRSKLGAAA